MVAGYWLSDTGEIAFLLLSIPAIVFWYRAAHRKQSAYLLLCLIGLAFIAVSVGLKVINGYAFVFGMITAAEHSFMLLGSAIISIFTIIIARRL
ncbi:hypothetical protein HY491_01455 [Candidatus Woesearchaeota archaeon]|nr:hypothetical protein [Candidatus Woesearchaeota archaeon]